MKNENYALGTRGTLNMLNKVVANLGRKPNNPNVGEKTHRMSLSASSAIFSASIREGRVALSVGHPRGTHSRYVIGCCLIPLGIYGLKNNSGRITCGIGCVWGMPSLSPLSSLALKGSLHRA